LKIAKIRSPPNPDVSRDHETDGRRDEEVQKWYQVGIKFSKKESGSRNLSYHITGNNQEQVGEQKESI